MPGPGNCPPVVPLSFALLATSLRAGLEPALLRAAAKSRLLPLGPADLAAAAPLSCEASFAGAALLLTGTCETAGIAFISTGVASDVPTSAGLKEPAVAPLRQGRPPARDGA